MSTIQEQIAEAKRELGMRYGVYPKRIRAKFMTQMEADKYLSLQEDIVATLQAVALAEGLPLFPQEAP